MSVDRSAKNLLGLKNCFSSLEHLFLQRTNVRLSARAWQLITVPKSGFRGSDNLFWPQLQPGTYDVNVDAGNLLYI